MYPEGDMESVVQTGEVLQDSELWAVSVAAHASAVFNQVLRQLADQGMYVHVEVVQVGKFQQVSCDLDLGARETPVGFKVNSAAE